MNAEYKGDKVKIVQKSCSRCRRIFYIAERELMENPDLVISDLKNYICNSCYSEKWGVSDELGEINQDID
jgi:hypothetical protein